MSYLLTAACVVGLVYWLSWRVLRDDLAPGPPPSPTGPVERCDLTPLIERADAAQQRDLALVLWAQRPAEAEEGEPCTITDEVIDTDSVDDLFVVKINGGKPDHAVRAADLLSANLYAKTLEGRVDLKADDGTVARLGLRIEEYIAANQVGCNKCHAIRPAAVAICPKCACPEYHRSPLDVAAERETEAAKPSRKAKAVAS